MEKKVQGGRKLSLKIKETKVMNQKKRENNNPKKAKFFKSMENILKKEKSGR